MHQLLSSQKLNMILAIIGGTGFTTTDHDGFELTVHLGVMDYETSVQHVMTQHYLRWDFWKI